MQKETPPATFDRINCDVHCQPTHPMSHYSQSEDGDPRIILLYITT